MFGTSLFSYRVRNRESEMVMLRCDWMNENYTNMWSNENYYDGDDKSIFLFSFIHTY